MENQAGDESLPFIIIARVLKALSIIGFGRLIAISLKIVWNYSRMNAENFQNLLY